MLLTRVSSINLLAVGCQVTALVVFQLFVVTTSVVLPIVYHSRSCPQTAEVVSTYIGSSAIHLTPIPWSILVEFQRIIDPRCVALHHKVISGSTKTASIYRYKLFVVTILVDLPIDNHNRSCPQTAEAVTTNTGSSATHLTPIPRSILV